MSFAKKVKSFNKDIKFQVGERVRVMIPFTKQKEVNCNTGIIVGMKVRFMHTPKMRAVYCTVRMDGEYFKAPLWKGIGELFTISIKHIKKEK